MRWFLLAFLESFIVVNFPFDAFILMRKRGARMRKSTQKAYAKVFRVSLNFHLKLSKMSIFIAVFIGLVSYVEFWDCIGLRAKTAVRIKKKVLIFRYKKFNFLVLTR